MSKQRLEERLSVGDGHSCSKDRAEEVPNRGRRKEQGEKVERRVLPGLRQVQLGELPAGWQTIQGPEVAPGTLRTLEGSTNSAKRPEPLPDSVKADPESSVAIIRHGSRICETSSRVRQFALWVSSDCFSPLVRFFQRSYLGRMKYLRKPRGGVTGIVVGDIVSRLVSRTHTQQVSKQCDVATSPDQYSFQTRAGCKCVAHMLAGMTDRDATTTIVSVDGVEAFDLISRAAMPTGLREMADRSF